MGTLAVWVMSENHFLCIYLEVVHNRNVGGKKAAKYESNKMSCAQHCQMSDKDSRI